MDLVGRLIGNRYEIIEKIGVGGMATVYKARCHVLNRYVAIKILREEFTTDAEFIKRFNSEAQSAASLTHPNIVSIYDVGNEGNLYYIVMELIQGKTLKEIINADGILPWKWSVNVAIQIASALEMAHKNNIIHRDIKPHNIIITEDGVAKVTDFGIAKAVSNSTITAFGTTIGSVHYFSPEHARGGYTDAKSDLYSLGIVLYEMLTGRVPFDADTPVSIALKHMQEEPVEPIKLNPSIPVSINKIIMKAMQKDANLRYNSATEMLVDLRNALKNPNGDFVVFSDMPNDFPTQKISTKEIQEKATNTTEAKRNQEGKKQNKLVQFFNRHKVLRAIVIAILCILIFVAAMAGTYFGINATRAKEVQIPSLVGMSQEEAIKTLEENKLEYEITDEYNTETPLGFVISQDPAYVENYNILEGSLIKIVVSKGEEIVPLPKLVGKTREEAEQTLKDLGLTAEIEEQFNDKVEAGYIISQDPEGDQDVPGKSTVKLVVSKGIEMSNVPDLLGRTESDAKELIEDAKLKLKDVNYDTDTTKENGVVLRQSIDSGEEVETGTEITITVNKLPEIKSGTVNIQLNSYFPGYEEETDENGNVINSEVEVEVKVGEDTVYKQNHKKDTENISVTVEGVGTVTIRVYIEGVLRKTESMNLNRDNQVLNISN